MASLAAGEEGFLAVEEVEEGSLNRTSKTSPTLAASGLFLERSRLRAPVGSRMASWAVCTSLMGVGKFLRVDGGGG